MDGSDAISEAINDRGLNLENLNELISGVDLTDPVAAIAQLQSATNLDPQTLLQAVTAVLTTVLEDGAEGEEEEYESGHDEAAVETGLGERKRRTRKPVFPRNEADRQRLKTLNRLRKKRWRQINDERNKDTDLRGRVNRRADTVFGKNETDTKRQWIEAEFEKRRQKRMQRMQRASAENGALGPFGGLFGQSGMGEELQAALAEIMGREGDIEKFNSMLLQLAQDPNLIKNITGVLQTMEGEDDGTGDLDHEINTAEYTDLSAEQIPEQYHEASGVIGYSGEVDHDEALDNHQLVEPRIDEESRREVDPLLIDPGLESLRHDQTNDVAQVLQQDIGITLEHMQGIQDSTDDKQLVHDNPQVVDEQSQDLLELPVEEEHGNLNDSDLKGVDQAALMQAFNVLLSKVVQGVKSDVDGATDEVQEDRIHEELSESYMMHNGEDSLLPSRPQRRKRKRYEASEDEVPPTSVSMDFSVLAARHHAPVPARPEYSPNVKQAVAAEQQRQETAEDTAEERQKVRAMGFPPMLSSFPPPMYSKR
ncbi:uncharacterized protein V1518DRAFT_408971 [Limtongia smithiae]|uniref:uncharacterized protein n=1 Tax=Limtongia smithiae TaxID=1125753 RepID=UPI0034CD3CCB